MSNKFKLSEQEIQLYTELIAVRDEKIAKREALEKKIEKEIKAGLWSCVWLRVEDTDHLQIHVLFDGEVYFYGSYGISCNWVSLYAVDKHEEYEDHVDMLVHAIEEREIKIERN